MKPLAALVLLWLSGFALSETLYCDQQTDGRQVVDNKVSHPRLKSCNTTDLEHVVPASWCLPSHCASRDNCNQADYKRFYKDPINLQPALSCINRSRGNKPYGDIQGDYTEYAGCDIEMTRDTMEPPDDKKAELALRTLYVASEYAGLCRFPAGYLDLMREWAGAS